MSDLVVCGKCRGLKYREVGSREYDITAGDCSDWSPHPCTCPEELSTVDELEITRDIRRRQIKFCPHCNLVIEFGEEE